MATLAPDTPPDRALRQIVAECHADLLKYRAVVLASRRAIGIHQTRVALRRLRAALTLFRDAVGPVEARLVRAMAAEAKWLAGECGPARDLHVFLTETVEDVPPLVKRIAARELGIEVTGSKNVGYIEYPSHYLHGLDSPVGIVFEVTAFEGALAINAEASNSGWFARLPEGIHEDQDVFLVDNGYFK